MKEMFSNMPPIAPSPEKESDLQYDPDQDLLKEKVTQIIQNARRKKMERVWNSGSKKFQRPVRSYSYEPLWEVPYPNAFDHPQKGHFAVTANFIDDASDQLSGGGWVASFENQYDAERCAYIVRKIDLRHEPKVESNEDWKSLPPEESLTSGA